MKNRFDKRLEGLEAKVLGQIYELITKIDVVKGQWQLSNRLSPQMTKRLQSSVIITSSGASTRIEGSKLSDREVEELYKKLRIQKFHTRDEQEVGGYLELLQLVFEQWEDIALSENHILSFHNQLMKHSSKDEVHKGKYKTGSNRVEARDESGNIVGVIFDPTPPFLVEKEMRELIDWTNNSLENQSFHPLFIIANFLFEFLAIHPFQDGNGRLSRILTNFLLLKTGYAFTPFVSHEKIIEENKADYYLALNKTQKSWKTENESILHWLMFFLKVVLNQSEEALKLLTQENVESFLSEKQQLVWDFALSKEVFSRKEVIEHTGLHHRTVEETIKKLLRMKKLERLGEGRATRYKTIG